MPKEIPKEGLSWDTLCVHAEYLGLLRSKGGQKKRWQKSTYTFLAQVKLKVLKR